jgi:long-chain fatty acid transport protein
MGMRLIGVCLGIVGILAAGTASALAGGIDNRTNWSAEYIRTLNRNASIDSADIAAYNPAGIMLMGNGTYLNMSAQYVAKTYTNVVNGTDLESDQPSIVPGLFGIYKRDTWAVYGAVTIANGGGKVKFEEGNATSSKIMLGILATPFYGTPISQNLTAESYYLGYTLGGAYKFNDTVSTSIGLRYVNAQTEATGAVTASTPAPQTTFLTDYKEEADGWGLIFGLDIAPSDETVIGIRYETKTELDFKATVNDDDANALLAMGITDGSKRRRDMPASLGLGVSHQCTPQFRAEADLTYYFNENADWNGAEDNAGNGYDVGLALEYIFNEKIKGSVGYMYTEVDQDAEYKLAENPALGASTVGAGFVYSPKPVLDLNFSVGKVFYEDASFVDQMTGLNIEYKKDIVFLAFGIQYKFI